MLQLILNMKQSLLLAQLHKLLCLLLLFISTACIEQFGGEYLHNFFRYCVFFILFVGFNTKLLTSCDFVQKSYVVVLLLGLIAHFIVPVENNPIREFLAWFQIVFVFSLLKYSSNQKSKILISCFLSFYIIECSLSVFERVTSTYIINYDISDYYSFDSLQYGDSVDFRSTSLLFHPLNNANVVSIFMAFFLTSKVLDRYVIFFFLCLGLAAMWGFNSRGAMLVWLFIIFYRFFLYGSSIRRTMTLLFLLALILPLLFSVLVDKEILGRLDFDFSDNSSQTRLMAFLLFFTHPWTIKSILFGGEVILMPGSDLSIENGILLTLSYWGWALGIIKIVLELTISYRCLIRYTKKDRFIILLAFWGVSFTNNNSFQPTMFTFYAIIFVFIQLLEYNIILRKKAKQEKHILSSL